MLPMRVFAFSFLPLPRPVARVRGALARSALRAAWALGVGLLAGVLGGCNGASPSGSAPIAGAPAPAAQPADAAQAAWGVLQKARASAPAIGSVRIPTATELLDWAERSYPELFPASSASATLSLPGYTYRIYSPTNLALAVGTDGTVVGFTDVASPSPSRVNLGSLADYACAVFPTSCSQTPGLAGKAGALADALGKPRRLLIGLGDTEVADAKAQGIRVDIWEFYLVGAEAGKDWRSWNQPDGAFVDVHSSHAEAMQAVPMFTLYQMATRGDGNISVLADAAFMGRYWDNVRVMFERIRAYGKPTLVNFEPDLWGYAQRVTTRPASHFVQVASVNPRCADQPNNMVGFGHCLLQMARSLAPNAKVGFPPSMFGDLIGKEVPYMSAVGAAKADFIVMQTLDRDAGCFELQFYAKGVDCRRKQSEPYYWDATNTAPVATFRQHFAIVRALHEGLGLPVLWWQTPLGVPSETPGGRLGAFRDNRVDYFFNHPEELVAAGGVGVVFGAGSEGQTNITTDGGQFKRLSARYLANPTPLP